MAILIDVSKLMCPIQDLKIEPRAIWPFSGNPSECVAIIGPVEPDKGMIFSEIRRALESAYPDRAQQTMDILAIHWEDNPKPKAVTRFVPYEPLTARRLNQAIEELTALPITTRAKPRGAGE